jgi:acylphosphatase
MAECKRYTIEGLVQGVFYRAQTQKKAQALGITGWVRNELDGSVTVYACGDPAAIEELESWLWVGPPSARVENVTVVDAPNENCQTFMVR